MNSSKVSEKYKIMLDEPFAWDYNPHDLGSYKTSKLLSTIENIDGVIDVEYDFAADTNFYITISADYHFGYIKKIIKTLIDEKDKNGN